MGDELGLDADDRVDAIEMMTDGWLTALEDHAEGDSEDTFAYTRDVAWGRLDDFLDDVEDERDRDRLLSKWTVDGRLDLASPDLAAALEAWVDGLLAAWPSYVANLDTGLAGEVAWFEVKDVAQRLGAGLGSLGTPRLVVLVEGPTDDDDDDRVLDVKMQGAPAAGEWLPLGGSWTNHAERVVTANRILLNEADDHLGWLAFADGAWSVRERSPWKATLDASYLDSPTRLRKMAAQWGYVLGTAHS
ncbi:MAG: DUF2252 family protein, partial [Myxococcales bacterium]|nr:DUF2252 family protein [Myxococcales bacterium]